MIAGNRAVSAATTAAVSSTDSVVWVMKASLPGSRTASPATSAAVSTSSTSPSGNCPIVPIASGCPAWPIITICNPFSECRAASECTLVTSGQVASTWIIWRRAASAGTDFGTPWAEKITGRSSGQSASSSTNTAPLARRPSTTKRLWTISWRT